jgi:hypothetical protein
MMDVSQGKAVILRKETNDGSSVQDLAYIQHRGLAGYAGGEGIQAGPCDLFELKKKIELGNWRDQGSKVFREVYGTGESCADMIL